MSWIITGAEKNPVDPYFSNVSLLLHGDGTNGSTTIVDSSPSPKTVTAASNAQISTAVADPFGNNTGVLAFNGTGDALTIPTSSEFDFGTGDFTVELWYYPVSAAAEDYARLFQTRNGDLYSGIGLSQDLLDPTNLTFTSDFNQSAPFSVIVTTTSNPITLEAWNHITIVRSGTTFTLYVNGNAEVSASSSHNLYYNSSDTIIIGGQTVGTSRSIKGYISDLRITKGVARYTSNFTPPTAPFPNA